MSVINQLKNMLSADQIADIAESVGETKNGVNKALGGVFPLLLGGLLKKSSESNSAGAMDGIAKLFSQAPSADDIAGKSSGLMNMLKGSSGLSNSFLSTILGGKTEGVASLISKISGVKASSATALLGMAVPLMMGGINKFLGGAPSVTQLTSLLSSQKDDITKQVSDGFGGALSLANLDKLDKNGIIKNACKFKRWIPKLLGLLALLIVLLFGWKLCTKENTDATAKAINDVTTRISIPIEKPVEASTEVVKNAWGHLGQFFSVALPNGIELNIPELGVENKLIDFIKDSDRVVDKTTWFSFDRLVFETGSAKLSPDSSEQIQNIAEILRAYPNVAIKIGGYTDNTGNPEFNLQLSQSRADAVRQDLLNLGISEARIEAKGYGQEHPVVPNDSDENRKKNRRIDLLITNK